MFLLNLSLGKILPTQSLFQQTQTLEVLPNQSLMHVKVKNHGMESSKSTPYLNKKTDSLLIHMDGQTLDIQETRVLIIAQWEVMCALEEQLQMPITNAVFMLELIFQEQMLR